MNPSIPAADGLGFRRDGLAIRPARPSDRAAVEAIAAQIWDGSDYLPDVFDAWVADPTGLFCVVTLRGVVIALGKLTFFPPDQWWIEGMRVDPAYRRQGVGRILHHYLVSVARRYAQGVIGLDTASTNEAVRRLAQETGFRRVAAFVPYGAAAQVGPPDGLTLLGPQEVGLAWDFLQSAPYFDAAQHKLEDHWRFVPLDADLLAQRAAAGLLYGWHGTEGSQAALLGVAVGNTLEPSDDSGRLYVRIGYLDAVPGQLPPLAQALRGLTAALGRDRVSLKPLDHPALRHDLEAAGYVRRWDSEIVLYMRDLALTAQAEVLTPEDSTQVQGASDESR